MQIDKFNTYVDLKCLNLKNFKFEISQNAFETNLNLPDVYKKSFCAGFKPKFWKHGLLSFGRGVGVGVRWW